MNKRNISKSYREAMVRVLGTKCRNCGSEENIEYHHVVPLCFGGNDKLDNMIALCNRCHKAAHNGRHMSHYRNNKNGGRSTIVDKEAAYEAFDLYFNGQIGNQKCKELIGYKKSCPIQASPFFKAYAEEKGIVEFKNTIDVAGTIGAEGLYEGRIVGFVKYTDGTIRHIFYRDTGANDVEYVRRAQ